jgi:NAD-dependent DNA ligase
MVKTSAPPPADKIFAGKTFVLQGDFGRFPRTHVNIAKLIARHGGRVDAMVTDRTNLVVTTLDEFRKRTPASMFYCHLCFLYYFATVVLCFFDTLSLCFS